MAPRLAGARQAAAGAVAALFPRARLIPFSLDRYGRDAAAPPLVVLWAAGASAERSLAFLRRARERLLWPPADADFGEAIAGLRGSDAPSTTPVPPGRSSRRRRHSLPAALLLEGTLDARRVRSALAARPPRDWIVESARSVRLSDRRLRELARRRIRLFALEPVLLVAVGLPADLARRPGPWKKLLPASAAVWTTDRR